MTDSQRALVTVIGGAIAILFAALSSLAVGPGPIFTFDKVVVGALLVGGLGAFGVAINIGQSAEARNARMFAKTAMASAPAPTYSDLDRLLDRIRKVEDETIHMNAKQPSKPIEPLPPTKDPGEPVPGTVTPKKPVAAGGLDF